MIKRNKNAEKKLLPVGFCKTQVKEYDVDWMEIYSIITINESIGPELTQNMTWKRLKFYGLTRIIITTAHLDRNRNNNEKENLAALCQRCHLRHDIHQHIRNRKFGRYHDREHQLKLEV